VFPLVRGDTSNIEGGDQIIPDLANAALTSPAFWSDVHQKWMPHRRANAYGNHHAQRIRSIPRCAAGHDLTQIIGGEVSELLALEVGPQRLDGVRSGA
jgi:hypothetical protein